MANASGQGGSAPGFQTIESHVYNVITGNNWTPALGVPVGKTLVGMSATVITFDAANSIQDADATIVTGLPSGYTTYWAADASGVLISPQIIASGVAGRILVAMTLR